MTCRNYFYYHNTYTHCSKAESRIIYDNSHHFFLLFAQLFPSLTSTMAVVHCMANFGWNWHFQVKWQLSSKFTIIILETRPGLFIQTDRIKHMFIWLTPVPSDFAHIHVTYIFYTSSWTIQETKHDVNKLCSIWSEFGHNWQVNNYYACNKRCYFRLEE